MQRWFAGGVFELVKHKLNLWDYLEDLKRNNYILELEDGIKLYLPYCRYFDGIQITISRNEDFYEIDTLNYLKKRYIKEGMNILDIGANIGNHTLFFAVRCKATQVFSFEPQKDIFKILRRNIQLNDLKDVCTTYNIALGAEQGTAKITSHSRRNSGGTTFSMDDSGSVCVRTLNEMNFSDIGFVKIDVEGFEFDVLKGGEELFRSMDPVIFIEIWNKNFDRVNNLLNMFGYAVVEIMPDSNYVYKKISTSMSEK